MNIKYGSLEYDINKILDKQVYTGDRDINDITIKLASIINKYKYKDWYLTGIGNNSILVKFKNKYGKITLEFEITNAGECELL